MPACRVAIDAWRSGTHPTLGYFENDYTITFIYHPGAPAQGPTYSSGGQPAAPAEVEFVSIDPGAGVFCDLTQNELEEWAAEWLDEHFDECVEIAEAARQPDPDAARDARIDDELMNRND